MGRENKIRMYSSAAWTLLTAYTQEKLMQPLKPSQMSLDSGGQALLEHRPESFSSFCWRMLHLTFRSLAKETLGEHGDENSLNDEGDRCQEEDRANKGPGWHACIDERPVAQPSQEQTWKPRRNRPTHH
jgi:hypothetical protein